MSTSTIHTENDRRLGRRRRVAAAASVASLALVLSACATPAGETATGDAKATSISIAMSGDPTTLTPVLTTSQTNINVAEQVTEKLIEFSADGESFEPRLATAWEQLDDFTTRITLREGVKFTNGEDFNAASAQYSIVEVLGNTISYGAEAAVLTSVEILDDYTIDVKSPEPSGIRELALASASFQYPMDYFAEVGEEGFSEAPIGTGPYTFVEWIKGDHLTLKANPDYWDGEPAIDEVIFKIIPDKSAQIAALQSGQIDFMSDVPVGSIKTVEGSADLNFVTRPSTRIFSLGLSTLTDTPIADPAVRRALQHAIDVEALIENQLGGLGFPLQGQALVPAIFGFDPSLEPYEYDVEKTKELLAAAGYPDGFTITFKYSSGRYAQDAELGQAIAAQLALVGITANQEVLESGTFIEQLRSLSLNDMYLSGSLPPLDAAFMYEQYAAGSPYKYYDNPTIDQLHLEQGITADSAERLEIFHEMTAELRADPPSVPLFQGVDTYVLSNRISGFTPRATQFVDLRELVLE